MIGMTIEERVAAGAEWLDLNVPGWDSKIDLSTLDIAEPCLCVLGQVYGHYFESPQHARIDDEDDFGYVAEERGFNGPDDDMPELNQAWTSLIEARRG